jgi:2-desacetyl-2-hydroxyethyl bacteriochlorophyllide A dehydrogenase
MRTSYPEKVKAVRWHGIDDLRLDTIKIPDLKDDQILVKNLYAGICGSDRHSWHDGAFVSKTSKLNYPAILGHEGSGEIVEIGKNVRCDAMGQPIKVGDMVAYCDVLGCGECVFCRQGTGNVCLDVKLAGQKPGVFVQYYPYPVSQVIKISGVTAKQGALMEPASTTLHANRRADVQIGDCVLVLGAGAIGLFRVQILRNQGATKIIVAEVQEKKRKMAKELGANIVVDPRQEDVVKVVRDVTNGNGADVVFEDAGTPETQRIAIEAVRPHGTVMLMGISPAPVTINLFDKVQLGEVTIKGTMAVSRQWDRAHDYTIVASLIENGMLRIDPIISHEFTIDNYMEGFQIADDSDQSMKVVLKIN